jgi:hypothetical protein
LITRWQQFTGQQAMRAATGEWFEQAAKRPLPPSAPVNPQ